MMMGIAELVNNDILHISDNPATAKFFGLTPEAMQNRLLENYNYTAITASDGMEALAIYAQHKDKISAAIIDLIMSNMDGATTIRTLQNLNPLLPIIVVSGLATSEKVPIDKTDEHTVFLPEPYTTQELLKTIHAVISQ